MGFYLISFELVKIQMYDFAVCFVTIYYYRLQIMRVTCKLAINPIRNHPSLYKPRGCVCVCVGGGGLCHVSGADMPVAIINRKLYSRLVF
jgi:hypothetical protein